MELILSSIAIGVAAVFALREAACWYFKVNEILAQQRETNRHLIAIGRALGVKDEPASKALRPPESNPPPAAKPPNTRDPE